MEKFSAAAPRAKQLAEEASAALTGIADKAKPLAATKLDPLIALKDLAKKTGKSIGQRALLGGVGALGGSMFGDGGAASGGLAGAVLGGSGALQMLRKAASNPAYRAVGANALASMLRKGAGATRGTARPLVSLLGPELGALLGDDAPVEATPSPEEKARAVATALRQRQ
jgi:hypothetical protein